MTKRENERLVLGLRAAGWNDEKINDFMLYMKSGEEQYQPEVVEAMEEAKRLSRDPKTKKYDSFSEALEDLGI